MSLLPRVLLLFMLSVTPALGDGGFIIAGVDRILREEQYLIEAHVDYRFSETALEALDHGVPLTINLHYRLRRDDAWIWEDAVVDRRQLYLIRYLPLTKLYQVMRLPDGEKQSFVTRDAAIGALGESGRLPLAPKTALEPDEQYNLQIKVSLDIESLPLPLRPVAYLRPSWKLSSGWTEWPFVP